MAICFTLAADVVAAGVTKPNVLLICVDDLKPLLGCYGDQRIQSPNLDRLAARGLLFERAYCNQAVCAPSRNTLLTGVRSSTLGIYDLGTNFRQSILTPSHCRNTSCNTAIARRVWGEFSTSVTAITRIQRRGVCRTCR